MAQLKVEPKKLGKRDFNLSPSEYKAKYPGMKRVPIANIQRSNNIRISKQKAERIKKSKKVRPHETLDAWERRMRKNNLMPENSIQKILDLKKYKVRIVNQARVKDEKQRHHANKALTVFFDKKHFDYLSYLGAVKTYFCIKYGIGKDDFEIALAFYNNTLICKERFYNICVLNGVSSLPTFKRFKNNNYIIEFETEYNFLRKGSTIKKTELYKLNKYLSIIISDFYKIMIKFEQLKTASYKGIYPPEVEVEFIKMNAETQDYLNGNKKQEKINK